MTRRPAVVTVVLALVALAAAWAPAAFAAQPVPGHTRIAPQTPRTNTPIISTGEIWDLAYIGNRVYVAGDFQSLRNNVTGNTTTVNQAFLAAFDINTGLVDTTFRPVFAGGGVTGIEPSPDGTKLYVVGRFNTVNGVTKRKIVSINPTTGATNAGFTANADGPATAVEATNTTVYVGGQFTTINGVAKTGLAAVNGTTGALVTTFNNNISGGIGVNGALTVQALVLSHDDAKLLVVHTGRQVAGQDRYGAALISTTTNQLLPWRTRLWDDNLQFVGGIQRAYAGDISPDDSFFVVTSGSGGDRPPISDTIIAFPLNSTSDQVQPLWISRAFDSVYSVAITEQGVYMGGHFNFNESPTAPDPWPGLDNVGYGQGQGLAGYGLGDDIVTRDHTGMISSTFGKSLEWNPGSNSFEGNKAMLATPRGIITGGDATTQGGYNVQRIAVYDFNTVPAQNTSRSTITSPIEGRVEESGVPFQIQGTATATGGVNRVQLEIQDRGSLRWLQDDLVTWGASNTINATLASPGAATTDWSLQLQFAGNRKYQVWSRAFATNGTREVTKQTKKFETFGLTDDTPTTGISGPQGSVIPTTTFIVTGTAQDDVGVNSITLTFRDAQNRYLQDDGSTSATYNTFRTVPDVVGATSATWQYEVTVPYESDWTMQAIAVDTAGQSDLRSADRTWLVSATAIAPSVAITTPAPMLPPTAAQPLTLAPGVPVTFSGSATDDQNLDYVEIQLRNSATREVLASDGNWGAGLVQDWYRISGPNSLNGTTYNWSYTTPFNLRPGTYTFQVRSVDDLGLTTANANTGRLTINAQYPGNAFPDALLNLTGTQPNAASLHLDIAGTATDDGGVAAVRVSLQDSLTTRYLQPNGTMAAAFATIDATLTNPGATSTTWTLPVDLPAQGSYSVIAYGYDAFDQQDPSQTGATATYPVFPGDLPPTVTEALLAPTNGTVYLDGKIFVSGRVEDDQQIARVQVAVINSLNQYMSAAGTFTSTTPTFQNAFVNSPGSPGSNFSYTTPAIPTGNYRVQVRGVDQHNLTTPVPSERTATVTIPANNLPPVPAFTYTCAANVCSFDARSSGDENAATLTYSWAFGLNQGTATGPVPIRTYTAAGSFVVTLTAKDEFGVIATTTQTIVMTEPVVNVPPTPVLNPPSCAGLLCNFSAVGTLDANVGDTITYIWNWGDGTPNTTTQAAAHTFPADGTYTVTLTATDGWLKAATTTLAVTVTSIPVTNLPPTSVISVPTCTLLSCTFNGSTSTDTDGTILSYAWNFGDGQTGTGPTPAHVYATPGTYAITLTVTDDDGATGFASRSLVVTNGANPLPVPSFTSLCTGLTCTFDGSTSTDDGSIASYTWNFGNLQAGSGATPSVTYATGGTYLVRLTVVDNLGASAALTQSVTVTGPNPAPVAAFSSSCTDLTCSFNGTASTDDGSIVNYAWDYGDGQNGTGTTPSHAYTAAGTYQVVLTVTDNLGSTGQITHPVTVSVAANPVAFRAAAGAQAATGNASVTIPAAVQAGDRLLLFVTANADTTAATPAGWTSLGSQQDGTPDMRTWVFTRAAVAGTGGSTVTSTLGIATAKSTSLVVAYSSAGTPTVIGSSVIGTASNSLAAPSRAVAANGSRAVAHWANKSADATAWTVPLGARASAANTGSGRIVSSVGDAAASAGTWPGATATVNGTASAKGIAFSVIVPPA